MIYILAVFLPFLAVMLKGRVLTGLLLLILQITVIGWLIAAPLAIVIIMRVEAERRHRETLAVLKAAKG